MKPSPSILIISFSLSGQTSGLLNSLVSGLQSSGCDVHHERLQPLSPIRFPFGSVPKTILMMLRTFLRERHAIEPLSASCRKESDLVILAGPTWSYHPSGPMLSFFDRDSRHLLQNKNVIPLISCRGYWRMHLWGLKGFLKKCGARMVNAIIFSHPIREPWRTLGVFLKLSGKHPEKMALMSGHYPRYGHNKEQQATAENFGQLIGASLVDGHPLADLHFQNDIALP
ncbi:MAG: hypothetical protein ABFS09_06800 [Thermodesulfobacteriota bacterium]